MGNESRFTELYIMTDNIATAKNIVRREFRLKFAKYNIIPEIIPYLMFMENRRELSQIYEHEVHTRVLFMNQMSQIEFPTFGEYKFLILSFEQLNLNFIFTQNILIYYNIQCKNKNKQAI